MIFCQGGEATGNLIMLLKHDHYIRHSSRSLHSLTPSDLKAIFQFSAATFSFLSDFRSNFEAFQSNLLSQSVEASLRITKCYIQRSLSLRSINLIKHRNCLKAAAIYWAYRKNEENTFVGFIRRLTLGQFDDCRLNNIPTQVIFLNKIS